MGAASLLGQLSVRPELREHFRQHLQRLSRQNNHPHSTYRERIHKSRVVPDANSYALRKYRKSTESAFCPNSHLMADNRLSAELRGCVGAFLEYIPHVSWLRECSVLYQGNQLCSPWGTALASHWGLSAQGTQQGRCLLEQYRCWPGWYLLKHWTGCNWLLRAGFTLTDCCKHYPKHFQSTDSPTYHLQEILP